MIFDTEQQRVYILQLIRGATFKGESLDVMYELKKAIEEGKVIEDN